MDVADVAVSELVNATSFFPLMGGGGLPFSASGTLPLACRWRTSPLVVLRAMTKEGEMSVRLQSLYG